MHVKSMEYTAPYTPIHAPHTLHTYTLTLTHGQTNNGIVNYLEFRR